MLAINDTNYNAGTPMINDTNWHHVAAIFDQGTIKYYIDGILQKTETIAHTSISSVTGALAIGGYYCNQYWNGNIDELKIYNYARTQKQIIEDMNAGHPVGGSPVGSQVGYWKFDEGYGTTANDSGNQASLGSPNNLTLSSASWTNSGKYGKAWNGTGTLWLSRADDSDFDFAAADDVSFSLWVKSDSATNPASTEYLLNKGPTSAAGYSIYFNTSGQVCFGIDDDVTLEP